MEKIQLCYILLEYKLPVKSKCPFFAWQFFLSKNAPNIAFTMNIHIHCFACVSFQRFGGWFFFSFSLPPCTYCPLGFSHLRGWLTNVGECFSFFTEYFRRYLLYFHLVKDHKSRSISTKGVTIRKGFQFIIVKVKKWLFFLQNLFSGINLGSFFYNYTLPMLH